MSDERKRKFDDGGFGGCLVIMFFLWLVVWVGREICGDVKAIRQALSTQTAERGEK